jgi:hypothetical protein
MSLSKEIIDGVNQLSGSAREDYGSFVGDWSLLMKTFAEYLDEPLDDVIRDIYENFNASEFVAALKLVGWEPNPGESVRDFERRLKALPIFAQLGLVDDDPLHG